MRSCSAALFSPTAMSLVPCLMTPISTQTPRLGMEVKRIQIHEAATLFRVDEADEQVVSPGGRRQVDRALVPLLPGAVDLHLSRRQQLAIRLSQANFDRASSAGRCNPHTEL